MASSVPAVWLGIGLKAGLYFAGLILVGLGLYQSGYTGAEWEPLKAEAAVTGRPVGDVVYSHDGFSGYLRLIWMTNSDERLYAEYARLTLHGEADLEYISEKQYGAFESPEESGSLRPYRDVRVEYPPVSLFGMTIPGVFTLTPWGYRFLLGLLNLSILLLAVWSVSVASVRSASREVILRRLLLFLLFLGIIVVTRMDLLATALLTGAMLASQRSRHRLAGLLTGLGIMAKLFPGVWLLVHGGLLLQQRRFGELTRFGVATVATVFGIGLMTWFWAGQGFLDTFTYHGSRGIQIESSYASLLLPLHLLFDLGLSVDLSFGSSNLITPIDELVQVGWPIVFVCLALPFAWATLVRSEQVRPTVLVVGILLSLTLAGKVFSPQYLIWVAPLLLVDAGSGSKRWALWLLLACLLSQIIYPRGYDSLKAFHPALVLVLLARNGIVVWLWWSMVREAFRRGRYCDV